MVFLPVWGYEGLYEVSCTGVIRSIDRKVLGSDGALYPFKGRELIQHLHKDTRYSMTSLWKNGKGATNYAHRIVAIAHLPNPNNLPEVNHRNGVRHDNLLGNLEWVTGQQNKQHAVNTGLRTYTTKMSRDDLLECLPHAIDGETYLSLSARTPHGVPWLSIRLRKLAREVGEEHKLNASLALQRAKRARINGAKHS